MKLQDCLTGIVAASVLVSLQFSSRRARYCDPLVGIALEILRRNVDLVAQIVLLLSGREFVGDIDKAVSGYLLVCIEVDLGYRHSDRKGDDHG